MRILLIEDDRLIGDGIKAGLSKLGFSVDWFTSGEAGFNALEAALGCGDPGSLTARAGWARYSAAVATAGERCTGTDTDRTRCARSAGRRPATGGRRLSV